MSTVYKWVDENGKTHYSDKPPINAITKISELSAREGGNKTAQRNTAEQDVSGAWWSMTNKGIRTLYLLDKGRFSIHQWSSRLSQLDTLMGGWWKKQNKNIILTYKSDTKNKQKSKYVGVSEALKIKSITNTRLSVIWPDNTQQNYVRLNNDNFNTSYKAELIMGEWFDHKKNKVNFSHGKITITPRVNQDLLTLGDFGKYQKLSAIGNWHLSSNNTLLDIEFVYNFSFSSKNKIGAKQSWRIETLNSKTLTLRHVSSNKPWLLTKTN